MRMLEAPLRFVTEPVFGLYAWVVRKRTAQDLLNGVFPITTQVDHAISTWLLRERRRAYAVPSSQMLFFSPKSEVGEDTDVQTMATVDTMLEKHQSWEAYYEHVWGIDAMIEDYILGAGTTGEDDEEDF